MTTIGLNSLRASRAAVATTLKSANGSHEVTLSNSAVLSVPGLANFAGTAEVVEALPTPLIDVGIGLNNLTDYTRVGISEIKGGTALLAATGRHANSYGVYAPRAVAYPSLASLSYTTPDIADSSTSVGETSGAHTFALVRTGSGLLPGMAAGSTGAQAASALTITAVSANSVTATGLTTANTTDYVGWHFLVTSGSAIGIARKITAHTAGPAPVFTLDSGTSWGTTPSASDKATLNYGQTTDYVNVLSTYRDDSSTVSTGGVHTTMGFGAFGRNTPTSTGYINGFFGLTINYSKNASVIGAELDVAGDNLYTQTYWQGGQPNSSAGLLIAGARGSYYTYTVTAVNASPATAIQQLSSTWVPNEHVGRGIYVSSGTQAGAQAVVTSNSGDTLTFTPSIPITGLVGATFQLGSLWNGVAIGIGTTGPDINRLGAGWKHGIFFDDYAFAKEGAFGIDFKPSSGVDFPLRIPNGGAVYAWRSGQTWAANYPAGTTYAASHPHAPLIGTLAGSNATYLGTDTQLVLADNSAGIFNTEYLRLGSAGLTFSTTGQKITGDFSNATLGSRVMLQTSTVNGDTNVQVIPKGAGTTGSVIAANNATVASGQGLQLRGTTTRHRLASLDLGAGSTLPIGVYFGATQTFGWETNGDVVVGTAALATNATAGFLFIESCAGTPTGVPSVYTGRVATVVDTTNARFYCYFPGVGWKYAALV